MTIENIEKVIPLIEEDLLKFGFIKSVDGSWDMPIGGISTKRLVAANRLIAEFMNY